VRDTAVHIYENGPWPSLDLARKEGVATETLFRLVNRRSPWIYSNWHFDLLSASPDRDHSVFQTSALERRKLLPDIDHPMAVIRILAASRR
jgi:hypothetical protein